MKYDWDPDKNEWLKKNRNISFEQIIFHLSQGDVWMVADHPDQEKFPDSGFISSSLKITFTWSRTLLKKISFF